MPEFLPRACSVALLFVLTACNPFIFSDDVGDSCDDCDPGVPVPGTEGRLTTPTPGFEDSDEDC